VLYTYYEGLTQQQLAEDLEKRNQLINRMQGRIIEGIADLIENRDSNTGTHIKNTSAYVEMLALAAKNKGLYADVIDDHYIDMITRAAPLHDVGKIVVSDSILLKPGKLTSEEFDLIKRHAKEGGRIVDQILGGVTDDEFMRYALEIAVYHHEKWDGSGYPEGLKGEEIPLSARIMALADVYDALIMKRPYKEAFSTEKALGIIEEGLGSHFDPELGKLFVETMRNLNAE
jgi:response regulator RpfG family c-di-GMP phosphodiesterase